jgi:hypothetical protein
MQQASMSRYAVTINTNADADAIHTEDAKCQCRYNINQTMPMPMPATKPTINTNAAINTRQYQCRYQTDNQYQCRYQYQDNINANANNISTNADSTKLTIPILIAGATPALTLPDCRSPMLVQY